MANTTETVEIVRFDPDTKYDFTLFDCGYPPFNEYLKNGIEKEANRRLSVSYLCVIKKNKNLPRVIGFYTLASSSFERKHLTNRARRKVPYQSALCILLSKLAVCKSVQEQGVGKRLLGRAINQAYISSREVGVYALFLQALKGKEQFYIDCGMTQSKIQPNVFIFSLEQYEQELTLKLK